MPQALQLGDLQASVLALPLVKRGLAQAVFAANLGNGLALALLAQDADYLGFTETTFFHGAAGKRTKGKNGLCSLLLTGLERGEAYTNS